MTVKSCILFFFFCALHQYGRAQERTILPDAGGLGRFFSADSITKLIENKSPNSAAAEKKVNEITATAGMYKEAIEKKVELANNVVKKSTKILNSSDSLIGALQGMPKKYINKINDKAEQYSSRITKKTEKTLQKLCKWEEKIHKMVQKASPEAARKLFDNNELTFASLLKKVKEKESLATAYQGQYNQYLDKLNVSVQYMQQQKDKLSADLLQPVKNADKKIKEITAEADKTEAIEQLIKERKKQLMNEAMKYVGKSNYLSKINKETWYYAETMKNYKEIFSDPDKTEKAARDILDKIPAFQEFAKQNSLLASLFGQPGADGDMPDLTGLQTRTDVQDQLRTGLASGGADAQQLISQNVQSAREQLNNLKDKVNKYGGDNSDVNVPDFKPNTQKTKTLLQRIEYGTNIQFAKNNSLVPSTADLALNVGYKLNDKSIVGIGASYKLGLGTLQHINFSHQGIGLRSYLDWKLKKEFYISGGFEMNQNAQLSNIAPLQNYNEWQSSGLIGFSKKLKVKTKFFKATKLQLFYDVLSRQHIPVSQPILFRVGYNFSK